MFCYCTRCQKGEEKNKNQNKLWLWFIIILFFIFSIQTSRFDRSNVVREWKKIINETKSWKEEEENETECQIDW